MRVARGFRAAHGYLLCLGYYRSRTRADREDGQALAETVVWSCGGCAGITGSLAARLFWKSVTIVEPNEVMHGIHPPERPA